jgi:2-keto-3-deoxy-L-rhamnonate aldolase RhmA
VNHPLFGNENGSGFKARLRDESLVQIGLFSYTGDLNIAEAVATRGIHFLVADMEGAPTSTRDVLGLCRTLTGSQCATLARPGSHDSRTIGQLLDLGVEGLIIPKVETAAQAKAIVEACRYPPDGTRGYNAFRAAVYGANEASYLEQANADVVCFAQIESVGAVAEAGEIAAVDGITGLFVGPGDLSLSLRALAGTKHPAVMRDSLSRVVAICHGQGKIPGIFAKTTSHAREYIGAGFRFIALGNDLTHFLNGLTEAVSGIRNLDITAQDNGDDYRKAVDFD